MRSQVFMSASVLALILLDGYHSGKYLLSCSLNPTPDYPVIVQ